MMTRARALSIVITGIVLAAAGPALGEAAAPAIDAEPMAGQLEVLQGTAVKLGGELPPAGPAPDSYRWEIVQGEGGTLYDADRPQAIFQAPTITDPIELFVIRMTVTYPDADPANATVHIRVHRDEPAEPATATRDEESIEDIMAEYYRKEQALRDENRRRSAERPTTVVTHSSIRGTHGWGWGGVGWGWPSRYPVYAPIVVPPPGVVVMPGDDCWRIPPRAVPYDEVIGTFPGHIADEYRIQNDPAGRSVPNAATFPAGAGGVDEPDTPRR